MTMHRQLITAQMKRTPTDGSGRFTALVSTFSSTPDSQGDIVLRGAYRDTIAEWARRPRKMALWWNHAYSDPGSAIGTVFAMRETEEGLVVEGMLNLSNAKAQHVYEGMLASTVGEFSIGYNVAPEDYETVGDVRYLRRVELLEISVVSMGANRETRLLSVKSAPRPTDPILQRLRALCADVAGTARTPAPARIAPENPAALLKRLQRECPAGVEELEAAAGRERAAAAKAHAVEIESEVVRQTVAAVRGRGFERVRVDSKMRPYFEHDDAREADRKATEQERRALDDRMREADDDRTRTPLVDGIHTVRMVEERGPRTVYAP